MRLILFLICCAVMPAQTTVDAYRRAFELRDRYPSLVENVAERPAAIEGSNRFWYRRAVKGGHEFIVVDAATGTKQPAFDHARLAAALSKATGDSYDALKLPFATISFVKHSIEVMAANERWIANLNDYSVERAPTRGRGTGFGAPWAREQEPAGRTVDSPDGKWEVLVRNYNLFLRPKGEKESTALSMDGSEGNRYSITNVAWSPDSKKLAAYRTRPGYARKVHYIESSPADQLQPKFMSIDYAKPGDALDLQQPTLFRIDERRQVNVDPALFPNPYSLSRIQWRKDSSAFTFEYNQRGHQVYRVIEVAAATGAARAVINEQAKTFFCYSGKRYRFDINDGKEIVWMSERDGWNHLYLVDGVTGEIRNQITKGAWVVRGVEKVDEEKRQVWFRASGMYPGKDPYFVHYYRINLDGTALTALTETDANHAVAFSDDMQHYLDVWSRVDHPPVAELRRTTDRSLVAEIERGDVARLQASGWKPPEVFTSVARDGKTDIWGVIYRPTNFDAKKKYPVVEQIYAGPQDSFVPKSFSAYNPMQALAELGFIVVQIDGMGTSNRSKAFHDYCWKNLADAGFPDRILWHKAVAAKYPWYDITRVGVYGNSAGGQNAMGALLFQSDFYKAAVASAGCHDNRMDKLWWNEQWMGWPIGPEYVACSNVENAHKLKGKLLLSVGEMDDNVDPSSTFQVVNALIKAEKTFDFIVLPGQRHTPGGPYGDRKRYDFFVRNLHGQEPPEWNALHEKLPANQPRR